jgi:taurine dioxygenase
MQYQTIQVTNMAPACGGRIDGVDLAGALGNQAFQEIHDALVDRTVIYFRDQHITPGQQIALARRFGEPQSSAVSAFEKNAEYPEIDILEYDAEHPPHITKDLWHTDFAGTPTPTLGTLLYALDIPPEGGDTIWVNMAAAYDALSDRMKAHLDGLWAWHDTYQPYDEHVRPGMWEGDAFASSKKNRATYRPALHPVVRTHPVSGRKGLFVNESMTTFIKDVDRRESNHLLAFLFEHLKTPEFQYRHKWQKHDLVIWDNRLSLHYALFDYTEHRLLHRITLKGDKPY